MTTRPSPRSGWAVFALWAGAGALVATSLAGAASIGLLVLPFAVAAVVLLLRRGGDLWPSAVGAVAGAGLVLLLIAGLNLDYTPCGDGALIVAPAQEEASCGGWNPLPFAVAGTALVGGAIASSAALRRRASL